MVKPQDEKRLSARVASARFYLKIGEASPAHEAIVALADKVRLLSEEIQRLTFQLGITTKAESQESP